MLSVQAVLVAGAVVLLSRGAAAEKALREQLVATETRLAALEKRLDDTDVRLQRLPRDSAAQVAEAVGHQLQGCPGNSPGPPPASPWIP
jgi:hypothetical protein